VNILKIKSKNNEKKGGCAFLVRKSLLMFFIIFCFIDIKSVFADWAKLVGERSKLQEWQLSLLADWHSSRETIEIINVIKSIVPEF
jgi:hypothetical protein